MQLYHMAVVADITSPWAFLVHGWRLRLAGWLHPYRPEEHYMRGPGPKCREKSTAPEDRAGSITMLFHGGTSRRGRQAYVRFCERLGMKVPGPIRPQR